MKRRTSKPSFYKTTRTNGWCTVRFLAHSNDFKLKHFLGKSSIKKVQYIYAVRKTESDLTSSEECTSTTDTRSIPLWIFCCRCRSPQTPDPPACVSWCSHPCWYQCVGWMWWSYKSCCHNLYHPQMCQVPSSGQAAGMQTHFHQLMPRYTCSGKTFVLTKYCMKTEWWRNQYQEIINICIYFSLNSWLILLLEFHIITS